MEDSKSIVSNLEKITADFERIAGIVDRPICLKPNPNRDREMLTMLYGACVAGNHWEVIKRIEEYLFPGRE